VSRQFGDDPTDGAVGVGPKNAIARFDEFLLFEFGSTMSQAMGLSSSTSASGGTLSELNGELGDDDPTSAGEATTEGGDQAQAPLRDGGTPTFAPTKPINDSQSIDEVYELLGSGETELMQFPALYEPETSASPLGSSLA
jgi:hypothetical protein